MSERPAIALEIASNPLFLSGVRELTAGVARRLGFTELHCSQIALAVDEALCNIMRHGYSQRTDGRIWLTIDPEGDAQHGLSLRIVLEDEGIQIDPCLIKGRDLDDIRPGGLGVHIIREVMDQVSYEKRAAGGMRLTLVKKQAPSGGSRGSSGGSSGGEARGEIAAPQPISGPRPTQG